LVKELLANRHFGRWNTTQENAWALLALANYYRILVTLNVKSNRPGRLVAVDDPVPSVFEAINPDFKLDEASADPDSDDQDYADYREIRGDRVQFFCDQLRAGDYTFAI
jgi:uncharacterized protein YfaS (alpha-2-macroglobulin family)